MPLVSSGDAGRGWAGGLGLTAGFTGGRGEVLGNTRQPVASVTVWLRGVRVGDMVTSTAREGLPVAGEGLVAGGRGAGREEGPAWETADSDGGQGSESAKETGTEEPSQGGRGSRSRGPVALSR